jgi:hypothetical protein
MAELHPDKWYPLVWFPTNDCAVGEIGEASAITHRTVVDFVLQGTFAWREALERIVGKAEGTVGGLLGLFPQISMARLTVSSVSLRRLQGRDGCLSSWSACVACERGLASRWRRVISLRYLAHLVWLGCSKRKEDIARSSRVHRIEG